MTATIGDDLDPSHRHHCLFCRAAYRCDLSWRQCVEERNAGRAIGVCEACETARLREETEA